MAEDPSLLESRSAEALLSMREKKPYSNTPSRRSGSQRLRKPNPRIFGDDQIEIPTTPKTRKTTKQEYPFQSKSTMKVQEKKVLQALGNRLKNLLKLPKAQMWVCYEWFYSNIDKVLFEGENDFCICLRESLPQLKTRNLTRVQWRIIRRLMGKPRRCSQAFFNEERLLLEGKRKRIRMLQQSKTPDNIDLSDLPSQIPLPLVIGTKVTARLRSPQNGLFTGVVDAVDTLDNVYRITFDKPGLGSHTIPDVDVLSQDSFETFPLSSVKSRRRVVRPSYFGSSRHQSSPGLANDPLLGSSPSKTSSLHFDDSLLGGFPVKLLDPITKVTKLLKIKKDFLSELKEMNQQAERAKSQAREYQPSFQQKYAMLLLDFEQLNNKISEYFIKIQHSWKEVDPNQGLSIIQSEEIKKKCQLEAEQIVSKTNVNQDKQPRLKSGKNLDLICKLLSLLLQIRTFADSEMHSFEFKSLHESLEAIQNLVDPRNRAIFQNSIQVHINHIQQGLSQTGNLQAFSEGAANEE